MTYRKILKIVSNVAEKASVAKEISRVLSSNNRKIVPSISKYNPIYQFDMTINNELSTMRFTSVRGHVKELQFKNNDLKGNWNTYDPQILFDAQIQNNVTQQNKIIVQNLWKQAQQCDCLILWLDCDQQGEAIANQIKQIYLQKNPNLTIKRARFSSISKKQLENALKDLVELNFQQILAVKYRTEIDFRVGCALTNFQTLLILKKYLIQTNKPLSFGTCLFPLLNIVTDKFIEKANHKSKQFWEIVLCCSTSHKFQDELWFNWQGTNIEDYQTIQKLYNDNFPKDLKEPLKLNVKNIQNIKKNIFRPFPLTTSSLLKICTKKFKMTGSKIMQVAQKLYQRGIISYPRTQTNRYPKSLNLYQIVTSFLANQKFRFLSQNILKKGVKSKSGNQSDQAHSPIYPVICADNLENLEEKIIYQFIVEYFLCGLYEDTEYQEQKITIEKQNLKFAVTGKKLINEGFMKYCNWQKIYFKLLPDIKILDPLYVKKLKIVEKRTPLPDQLTESYLISLMQKFKIGTDSTIHEHIKNIQTKGYVIKNGDQLTPSKLGLALVSSFRKISNSLCDPNLRSYIQENVKKISSSQANYQQKLKQTLDKFKQLYKHLKQHKIQFLNQFAEIYQIQQYKSKDQQFSLQCNKCKQNMHFIDQIQQRYLQCKPCSTKYKLPKEGLIRVLKSKCVICNFNVLQIRKKQAAYNICCNCFNNPQQFMKQQSAYNKLPCFRCQVKNCIDSATYKHTLLYKCTKCKQGTLNFVESKEGLQISCNNTDCSRQKFTIKNALSIKLSHKVCKACQKANVGSLIFSNSVQTFCLSDDCVNCLKIV